MDSIGYVDLFATKGMEYILVAGFLLALTTLWFFLRRRRIQALQPSMAVAAPPAEDAWFRLSRDRYYHPGHTWVRTEGADVVRVGLDDFAQKLLGAAEKVIVPAVGSGVEQGVAGVELSVAGRKIEVLAPINGEVLAVNQAVLESPELINRDPYGAGWLMRVKPSRLGADLKNLLTGGIAMAWMQETADELRRRVSGDLGLAMQDGGTPVAGIAKNIAPDHWEAMAAEFLLTGEPSADRRS